MVDPNIRVFDCGGVLVQMIISDKFVNLRFFHDYSTELHADYMGDRELIKRLFPNGYTKPSAPKPEQSTEVTE